MLAEHLNDLLPREAALKKIWGSDTYFNGRSMDVYIAKLRKYLRDDGNIEIVNIHGNGFRLVAPVKATQMIRLDIHGNSDSLKSHWRILKN